MVLVDNLIYSFGSQLDNGIPILPFKESRDDIELVYLMKFLIQLHDCEDIRIPLKQAFNIQELSKVEKYDYANIMDYYDLEEFEIEQAKDELYRQ